MHLSPVCEPLTLVSATCQGHLDSRIALQSYYIWAVTYRVTALYSEDMQQYLDLIKPTTNIEDVEIVRIFTASGHPWMAFASLVVRQIPFRTITSLVMVLITVRH